MNERITAILHTAGKSDEKLLAEGEMAASITFAAKDVQILGESDASEVSNAGN